MSNSWRICDYLIYKKMFYTKNPDDYYLLNVRIFKPKVHIQKLLLNLENNDNTKLQLHVKILFYFLTCFVIKENDAVMYNLRKF